MDRTAAGEKRRRMGKTGFEVYPLCLGGNVFGKEGRTDEGASWQILDRFVEAGGNCIDTADIYGDGKSEEIIGRWMSARHNRDDIVIATKVGFQGGLSPENIRLSVEGSLRRLGVDRIDLYYAHTDDKSVPLVDVVSAFDALVREGKVVELGASNFTVERLDQALTLAQSEGLHEFRVIQPHFNLVHRTEYEGKLQDYVVRNDIAVFPYYGLASGFLTGKYRKGASVDSTRAQTAWKYLDGRGERILGALDRVAQGRDATVAQVALAWLAAMPGVTAPIASARTVAQLEELLPMTELHLSSEELEVLTAASS